MSEQPQTYKRKIKIRLRFDSLKQYSQLCQFEDVVVFPQNMSYSKPITVFIVNGNGFQFININLRVSQSDVESIARRMKVFLTRLLAASFIALSIYH